MCTKLGVRACLDVECLCKYMYRVLGRGVGGADALKLLFSIPNILSVDHPCVPNTSQDP